MTAATQNGRAGVTPDLARSAIRTATVELGGDYEGWHAEMRVNPPNRIWKDFSSGDQERFRAALAFIVSDWNFVDDAGQVLPLPHAGLDWDEVPFDLETSLVNAYTEVMKTRASVPKEISTTSEPGPPSAT